MRKLTCDICGTAAIPQNDSIKIEGKNYCSSCFESHFPEKNDLKDKLVEKELDPTICSSCSKDFGDQELEKHSVYPICTDCKVTLKNKTFPTWVKAFSTGIIVIVVVAFFWNWKYYTAYQNIKDANAYFQKSDYSNAALSMKSAVKKVPEVEDLKTLSSYYNGINFLYKDKSAAALAEFEKCKEKLPPDFHIETLIVEAKIGVTFDNKDYKGFLAATKESLALDTTSAAAYLSVASAYACLYAESGDELNKQSSLIYLQRAKLIDSTSEEIKSYYNMIEYRLDSRKIIRREEFTKQFPNGWTK